MKLTVNNKEVRSDKQMSGIVNSTINFTDGSWCNVDTNQVFNNTGKGFIIIDGGPLGENGKGSQDELTTVGPKNYKVKILDIQNLNANVDIQPTEGNDVTLIIIGLKPDVEKINISEKNETLSLISLRSTGSSSSKNIIFGSVMNISGSFHLGDGGVSINSVTTNDDSNTKISIGIPKGLSVKISGVEGNVVVGDIECSLNAIVKGATKMKIGKVLDSMFMIQGSGDIIAKSVNGNNLSMTVQGSGDIKVNGGHVTNLNVDVNGSGDIKFKGEAENANLTVMGSGDIDVSFVKNSPNKSIMGCGEINVGNWDE